MPAVMERPCRRQVCAQQGCPEGFGDVVLAKHERVRVELIGLDATKLSDDQWQQCCSVSGAIFCSAGVGLIRLVD